MVLNIELNIMSREVFSMVNFRTKKFSTAFLLPIILTVSIVLMLLTIFDAFVEKSQMIDELNKKAESMLNISSASAADAFWNYNDISLKKIGDTLSENKEVAEIRLIDEENNVVYETQKITKVYDQAYLYPEFEKKIMRDEIKIGEIQLVFTTYYLNKEITKTIIRGFVRTIFINMIIVFIIILLSRNITTAIDKIDEGVKAFSNGDAKNRIQLKNRHEIRRLADRINSMLDIIVESRIKLSENYQVLKKQEEELRVTEERYRYAVEGSNDAIWDWNLVTKQYYVSVRGLQMVGLSERDTMNLATLISFIHPQDRSHFKGFLKGFYSNSTRYGQVQIRVIGSKGEIRWIFCRGKGILNQEGKLIRVSGFYTDITERITAEEAINRLAYYDVLTGLPNRSMLFERLNNLFDEQIQTNYSAALLYIDLDNFKVINDTKGHATGDSVLVKIAEGLVTTLACDAIARIGGDEFVIIHKNCNEMGASELANETMNIINKTWNIEGYEFNISCSIGIAIYPQDGADINKLLMNADSAMYQAKEQGKNQFKFYDQRTNDIMVNKIEMQNDMRQGIINHEFVLYYQPQVDFISGYISAVEALVRWQHPVKGLLPPVEFIGIAEDTGLIIPLGEQILRAACQQSVRWESAGLRDISVAVNFSAKQINKKDIIHDIYRILEETGMRPELLDIEITESIAMENLENTIMIMNSLKEIGIKFSLDDFGTGYSSLNYLNNLPIDHLKIDKKFVQNMNQDNFEEVVVKAIIEIAHNMNLIVIAEGIETMDQYEIVMKFKGDRAQGYFFSRPVPSIELEGMMQRCLTPKSD